MPKTNFRKDCSSGIFTLTKLLLFSWLRFNIWCKCLSESANHIWKQVSVSCTLPRRIQLSEKIILSQKQMENDGFVPPNSTNKWTKCGDLKATFEKKSSSSRSENRFTFWKSRSFAKSIWKRFFHFSISTKLWWEVWVWRKTILES